MWSKPTTGSSNKRTQNSDSEMRHPNPKSSMDGVPQNRITTGLNHPQRGALLKKIIQRSSIHGSESHHYQRTQYANPEHMEIPASSTTTSTRH